MHSSEKVAPNMDIEKARFNMVEQQIRPWEVLDQNVLDLLFHVKREDFVPTAYKTIAFTDMEIPIGHAQFMMPPKIEARIVQEIAPKKEDRILEIGTGSGYLTALLAKSCAHVTSIEIFEELSKSAAQKLAAANINNVKLVVGDAAVSPAAHLNHTEKFDAVVLTGSVPVIPKAYYDYLAVGGRMLAIVGDEPAMTATLVTRVDEQSFKSLDLFETVIAPLINAVHPSRFTF
jgi:protein-L-isoaspartate(D-aspartate) O-methyltransferase